MEEGNKYKQLIEDGQQYIRTRYDLLRLELLEKMSRIFALILMLLVSIILALTAFIYFSFAFVRWLGQFFNNDAWAFCIVGAIFLLLLGIFFFFRKSNIFVASNMMIVVSNNFDGCCMKRNSAFSVWKMIFLAIILRRNAFIIFQTKDKIN